MITVNNKAVIKKIADAQAKSNKSRNRLLLLAIVLVTFLLTTVMSVGINYYKTLQERNISMEGDVSNASMRGPSEEQLTVLKNSEKIKDIGLHSASAAIDQFKGDEVAVSLLWADDTYWNKMKAPALEEMEGHYPKEKNEVLLSRKALKKMQIKNPKLGMIITVHTVQRATGEERNETFALSGIYNDYTNKAWGFISKEYWEASGTKMDDLDSSSAFMTFSTPFFFEKDGKALEKKLKLRTYQWLYYDPEVAKDLISTCAGLLMTALVIGVCAYLVIYNILFISISKEIHYYGLLKTIGTTQKQIRQIIFRQIAGLSMFGIPLGLLLGAGLTSFAVSGIVSKLNYGEPLRRISFNPLIFLGAALFSLITIIISIRKPTKIAASISPVEAVNYTGKISRSVSKKRSHGGSVFGMAWRNIFRSKKQALLVLASLFLGLTSFLAASSITENNDGKRILDFLDVKDMKLTNKTNYHKKQKQVFDQTFLDKISKLEGVKGVHPILAEKVGMTLADNPKLVKYMEENFKYGWGNAFEEQWKLLKEQPENYHGIINGIDDETFKEMKKKLGLQASLEDFKAGKVCVVPTLYLFEKSMKAMENQTLTYTVNGRKLETEVAEVTSARNVQHSQVWDAFPSFLMSEKKVQELFGAEPYVDTVIIDYTQSYDRKTDRQIKALIKERKIDDESRLDQYDNMKSSENQMKITSLVLAGILALLGLMNYFSTMVTSITSRVREFALLESIGMTRRQQKKMLVLEGLSYGLISMALTSTAGLAIAYFIFHATDEYGMDFLVPGGEIAGIYLAALLICIFVPLLIYRLTVKGSIIEQLRAE